MFQLDLLHDPRPKKFNKHSLFIIHLQNWIDSVQPHFHELQADSIEEGQFGVSEVNICMVEEEDEVAIHST